MTSQERMRYRRRLADRPLAELLSEFPAVLINGPRAVGKTTTGRQLAAEEVSLDQPGQATIFRSDPDAALRDRGEPLLIDEWQEVPAVLGAIKRAVDDDPRPGRFILTGSVRAELEHQVWPGTGRLVRVAMHGLTERELKGSDLTAPPFVARLEHQVSADRWPRDPQPLDIREYVDRAIAGGFPDLRRTARSARGRHAWLSGYLEQLLTRDTSTLSSLTDTGKLRRYFEVLAASDAGIPSETTLFDAAAINRRTALRYDQLLSDLYVSEPVPAWHTNRLARVEKRRKRYLTDPALAATAANLDRTAILNNGDLLGRALDAFVVAQLRPEAALAEVPPRLHHLRTEHGRHEIDLVVELSGGRVIGLEIKATASPDWHDAKHLRWLRDELGELFVAGAVLHTGPRPFDLDDRILALPISSIWS